MSPASLRMQRCSDHKYRILLSDGRPAMSVCGGGHDRPFVGNEVEQIRDRSVVCWNACLDIPADMLESVPRLMSATLPYRILQAQQAELLAALKDVLGIATAASVGISGNQPRLERARAALAKATGVAT